MLRDCRPPCRNVLYIPCMVTRQQVSAWRPRVPGVVEVFPAHFTEHAHPMHVHDVWTLLVVNDGVVRSDLNRHERGTPNDTVPYSRRGCRTTAYPNDLVGSLLRRRIGHLHTALAERGDELEAQSRLTPIRERLRNHLRPRLVCPPAGDPSRYSPQPAGTPRRTAAPRGDPGRGREAAERHPTHLVRAFSGAFGAMGSHPEKWRPRPASLTSRI